jgi:hypothetical protein
VVFDTANPPQKGSVVETKAFWLKEKKKVTYSAVCVRSGFSANTHELVLSYSASRNPKLKSADVSWGEAVLRMTADGATATAVWNDEQGKDYSGKARAQVLSVGLLDEFQYKELAARIARPNQNTIRQCLLEHDGVCAITGEATMAVLDVAHLIDVGRKGATGVENCVLLRTDLHRLFDKGLISIMKDGTLELADRLSDSYRRELKGKRLDKGILARVSKALSLRERRFIATRRLKP